MEVTMFAFNFNWSPDFETGIEEIDLQHKQYFKIGRDIEQLLQYKCIGVTDKQLIRIVGELIDFIAYHNYQEESLMRTHNYSDLDKHMAAHKDFSDKVSKFNLSIIKKDPEGELKKLRTDMQDFFLNHILNEDMKMTRFVIKAQKEALKPKKAIDDKYSNYGVFIKELDVTTAFLFLEQSHRGRVALVYKNRANSMEELVPLERNMFFSDISRVAKAIKKIFAPKTINYGVYGDIDDKIIYHIVPKYENDFEWQKPFAYDPQKYILEEEEYTTMAAAIRAAIK